MNEQETKDLIIKTIREYDKTSSFAQRKVADTPTDALQVANKNYVDRKALQMVVFAPASDVTTGDGKFYVHIDSRLNKLKLNDVHAEVITAGTTNTTDIQIANVNGAVDMLSTKLTVDSGETGSDTAATPAVINPANARVTLNDVLRIDVDAVSTTAPKGLIITLGFVI